MIPLYPEGTTLASIVRITMLVQRRELDLKISTRVLHGWGICEIAEHCLPPSVDLRVALRRYSAAPVLLSLRQDEHAAKLEEDLLQGRLPKTGPYRVLPVSTAVRRCPICVVEDLRDLGVACARVLHQVIGVAHCPFHNIPLQQACSKCGKEFEELTISGGRIVTAMLDLQHCPACGCPSGVNHCVPKADAYRLYVDLLVDAMKGDVWLLRPEIRLHLVEAATKCAANEGIELTTAFAKEWGTDSFDDAAAMCSADPSSLKRALFGMNLNINPTATVMSIAFVLTFLAKRKIFYEGEFCEFDGASDNSVSENDTLENRLQRVGKKLGVPRVLIERLAEGSGRTNVWAKSDAVGFLLDSLSDADRRQLDRRQAVAQALYGDGFGAQRAINRAAVLNLVRKVQDIDSIPISHRELCIWSFVNDCEWFEEVAPRLYQSSFNLFQNFRPEFLASHRFTHVDPSAIATKETKKRPANALAKRAFNPAVDEATL